MPHLVKYSIAATKHSSLGGSRALSGQVNIAQLAKYSIAVTKHNSLGSSRALFDRVNIVVINGEYHLTSLATKQQLVTIPDTCENKQDYRYNQNESYG
ncbi:hypothetical protein J6590_046874 [Homalodisca vitripennis]|nr:hypothetical protein J6590_046874 [Homalodisca vitripennis]